MTIASEITRINNNIAAAYTSCNAKGATMPVTQNSANLADCIDSISGGGGEVISVKNTTGSTIAGDTKVWINESSESSQSQNFTIIGNPTFTGDVVSNFDNSNYLTLPEDFPEFVGSDPWELVFKVIFSNSSLAYMQRQAFYTASKPFGTSFGTEGSVLWMNLSNSDWTTDIGEATGSTTLVDGNTYYVKAEFTGTEYDLYLSEDGTTWNLECSITSSTPLVSRSSDVWGIGCYFHSGSYYQYIWKGSVDLSGCYIKRNGVFVWKPYETIITSYSIIPSKDISSTSIPGKTIGTILANNTGNVEVIMSGTGTYAPATTTKTITANGTYTASDENAYGLSQVTVNIDVVGTIITATNNTGSSIWVGDKVWICKDTGNADLLLRAFTYTDEYSYTGFAKTSGANGASISVETVFPDTVTITLSTTTDDAYLSVR